VQIDNSALGGRIITQLAGTKHTQHGGHGDLLTFSTKVIKKYRSTDNMSMVVLDHVRQENLEHIELANDVDSKGPNNSVTLISTHPK
jgi:hypothetical protein